MSTNRAKQLEKLAMSLPQANQQQAQGAQQARQVQLQEQIRQMQPGIGSPAIAQQMGAQQAQQAGQIQLGAAAQTQQQQQLVAQEGLAGRAREQRQAGFQQQMTLSSKQRDAADKLARLDINLKKQLLDDQLAFKQDQAGQALLNQRQLADWAATKAQNAEEYAQYVQAAEQVYSRELQMMQTAQQRLTQALKQGYLEEGQALDQQTRQRIGQAKKDMDARIKKKAAEAANNSLIMRSVLGIAGGVGGFFAGGPAGILPGIAAGEGVGSIAAGAGAKLDVQ